MSLIEWNPFRDLDILTRDIGRFFDRPFKYLEKYGVPRTDIYETETDVVIKAELAGMSKDDINLYVDENSVRLSGQKQRNNEIREENLFHSEQFYGSFSRTIPLPAEVEAEKARAEYKDGILSIVIPKSKKANIKGKKIPIQ